MSAAFFQARHSELCCALLVYSQRYRTLKSLAVKTLLRSQLQLFKALIARKGTDQRMQNAT